jgi:hypothetical protein
MQKGLIEYKRLCLHRNTIVRSDRPNQFLCKRISRAEGYIKSVKSPESCTGVPSLIRGGGVSVNDDLWGKNKNKTKIKTRTGSVFAEIQNVTQMRR